MKTPEQVSADVERRLARTWADEVATVTAGAASGWPHEFPLGRATSADLATRFGEVTRQVAAWRDWARSRGVELAEEVRRVSGTEQRLPTHLVVDGVDTAARLAGGEWPGRLERGRARAVTLANRFPGLQRPGRMLAATDAMGEVDFDLLMRAADWFALHAPTQAGMFTPRQVPVEGLHAKWLNTRRHLVAELAGVTDLGLLPPHPARVHFTYLDPAHLVGGGRRHDSASVGDNVALPYPPRVVLISENKDTCVGFPPVPGGVAVEGGGRGAAAHAALSWVRDADVLAYWGDMDADGLEILNEFRSVGLACVSLLMDMDAYVTWERYATGTDKAGRPLGPRDPRPVEHLKSGEAQLYAALTSPAWTRARRLEQERIPLGVAHEQLTQLARQRLAHP